MAATKLHEGPPGGVPAPSALAIQAPLNARRLLAPLFGATAVLVAFAATEPLAHLELAPPGVGLVDRAADHGAGPLSPAALLYAVIALAGLGMVHARRGLLGSHLTLLVRLAAIAAGAAWLTLLGAAAAGWAVDLDQFVLVSLALPLVWLSGYALLAGPRRRERVLLIGSGQVADRIAALSRRHPEANVDVVGCLDDAPLRLSDDAPVAMGGLADLPSVLSRGGVDRVIVCFSQASDRELAAALRECDAHDVALDMVPRMFDLVGPAPTSRWLGGFPLVSLTEGGPGRAQAFGKRAFDLAFTVIALVPALPVMAAVACAIKLDSRGPVLYRSERLGRAGRPFRMLKFRTMTADADRAHGEHAADLVGGHLKRRDDPRVTRVGRVLRCLSLDELPQLFNILGGTMSVVGPRPVLVREAHGIEGWATRRHNVRPGVTGLWQVLGRSVIPWDERMQLDYTYARHWSLGFDLKILASTFAAVASRRGAY